MDWSRGIVESSEITTGKHVLRYGRRIIALISYIFGLLVIRGSDGRQGHLDEEAINESYNESNLNVTITKRFLTNISNHYYLFTFPFILPVRESLCSVRRYQTRRRRRPTRKTLQFLKGDPARHLHAPTPTLPYITHITT